VDTSSIAYGECQYRQSGSVDLVSTETECVSAGEHGTGGVAAGLQPPTKSNYKK